MNELHAKEKFEHKTSGRENELWAYCTNLFRISRIKSLRHDLLISSLEAQVQCQQHLETGKEMNDFLKLKEELTKIGL
jgi:hypothetical protein